MAFKHSPLLVTLLVQMIVILPSALIAWSVDKAIGLGWTLGTFAFVLPNAMFTYYTFRYRGTKDPVVIHRSFASGAAVKLALTIISLALVFKHSGQAMNTLAFFAGYLAMVLVQLYIAGKRIQDMI
jgi:F0F1-type ATP synthase assembly protein I